MARGGDSMLWAPSSPPIDRHTRRVQACSPLRPSLRDSHFVTTRKARDAHPAGQQAEDPAAAAPDFEKALGDLETIVEQLEQGELSLDESLKAFERGVALTRQCQSALKQAEQKVEILLRKTGQPETFDSAATGDD